MKIRSLLIIAILLIYYPATAQYKLEKLFAGGDYISFTTSTEGFSYGTSENNIYHTTDAGYNWKIMATNIQSKTGGWNDILNMAFLDSNNIFAISYDNNTNRTFIYKTTNGGSTWSLKYTSDTSGWNSPILYSLYFTDAMHGWAIGNHIIMATTDGGSTWQQQLSLPSGSMWLLQGAYFFNNSNGYICGDGRTVLHTTNGGASWTIQNIDTAGAYLGIISNNVCYTLTSIYFRDNLHGYIAANNGGYMTTADGGLTWTPLTTGFLYDYYSTHMSDTGTQWLAGGPYCDNTGCFTNTVILFNRNNTGWQKLIADSLVYTGPDGFKQIHFLNPTLGYAASANNGYIYRIIDTTTAVITDTTVTNDTTVKTSVKNISAVITKVYPNPATDFISLSLAAPVTGTIGIYNTIGQKMITADPGNTNTATMNVSGLTPGNYFIVVHSGQQVFTTPFTKL